MLQLFRTNKFAANIFLLIYVILIRMTGFIFPTEWEPGNLGILSEWTYSNIGTTGMVPLAISIVLIFIQAFLINQLVSEYRLNTEINLFPGVFYILLVSAIPDFLQLSPILLANTFLIIGLQVLFSIYNKSNRSTGAMFNAGFWFGIGSLFCFSWMALILLGIAALSVLKGIRMKEVFKFLIGWMTPYYFLWVYYYFFDRSSYFYNYHFLENISFMDFTGSADVFLYVKLGVFALLLVLILISYGTYMSKKNIKSQKYITILYWGLFAMAFTLLFQSGINVEHLMVLSVPLAIFIGLSFTSFKKSSAEFFHILLLISIIILQLKPLWSI